MNTEIPSHLVRMVIVKKRNDDKCWRGRWERIARNGNCVVTHKISMEASENVKAELPDDQLYHSWADA